MSSILLSSIAPRTRMPVTHRVAPGKFWVGAQEFDVVQTLLGSCVSVVAWQPAEKIGAMCHYMLPSRPAQHRGEALDAMYAEEAFELMLAQLRRRTSANLRTFKLHLFGGAKFMRREPTGGTPIGDLNVAFARDKAKAHSVILTTQDVLADVPRTVTLDTRTGQVSCRRGSPVV